MGLFSDNRIMYGGRAPSSWRVGAYLIVGVVLLASLGLWEPTA
jgi:hypothetical protein